MPIAAPSSIFALTITVPAAVVFNILLPVMVAPVVPGFSTVQTMVWFVALAGTTVATRAKGAPAVMVSGDVLLIDVTGTILTVNVATFDVAV